MVLRKITVDDSAKYVAITEKDIKQNMTKNKKQSEKIQPISGGGKQNKNCSKNNKTFLNNVAASGFGVLTK